MEGSDKDILVVVFGVSMDFIFELFFINSLKELVFFLKLICLIFLNFFGEYFVVVEFLKVCFVFNFYVKRLEYYFYKFYYFKFWIK